MNEHEYQLDIRLDGKFYCRIYQHGIPRAIATTDDYDTEEEAIERAEAILRGFQEKPNQTKA